MISIHNSQGVDQKITVVKSKSVNFFLFWVFKNSEIGVDFGENF